MIRITHPKYEQDARAVVGLLRYRARIRVVEDLVPLFPYNVLLKMYRDIHGESPSKGQFPSSSDRFLRWEENVHASLFYNYYMCVAGHTDHRGERLVRAYELYTREVSRFPDYTPERPFFSISRAWMLLRLMRCHDAPLTSVRCSRCGGAFIRENYNTVEGNRSFVCVICKPPNHRKEERSILTR